MSRKSRKPVLNLSEWNVELIGEVIDNNQSWDGQYKVEIIQSKKEGQWFYRMTSPAHCYDSVENYSSVAAARDAADYWLNRQIQWEAYHQNW